ncbi:putative tubulin--tyrosine ligase pby1 [Malassezia cuniculi]|uniref:Tubulin--tyrosine ligase pby1 n=1 Tax=Malassezia cuniculi TaxID=948313 RepID=A0AAF0EWB1_9BASI|nr:putative tubulin--tyrosine ligase pby1 [Malassezia cuniculi]
MPRRTVWVCFPGAEYTQRVAEKAAKHVLEPAGWQVNATSEAPADGADGAPDADAYLADYDYLPFERIFERNALCSSYMIRKALIRKHYLAQALATYAVKKGTDAVVAPATWTLDCQFADELDEILADDLYEVKELLDENEALIEQGHAPKHWLILKPGMADQGHGIQLFSTEDRLREIFTDMEMSDDEDDQDEANDDASGVVASQLRHFVVQKYIHDPLLIRTNGTPRKFHLRAYVLCVGGLAVYLMDDMLALFATDAYSPPSGDGADMRGHLTNTCVGVRAAGSAPLPAENVFRLSDLEGQPIEGGVLTKEHIKSIHSAAVRVVGTAFEAAARTAAVHWQLWPNAFELFGVDLLVSGGPAPADLGVWLLEINAQPDYAQSGERLERVIEHVFERALQVSMLDQRIDTLGASVDGCTLCFSDRLYAK